MTLHIVNKSTHQSELQMEIANAVEPDDEVILIEDGVYICLANAEQRPLWTDRVKHIHVLESDALARGVEMPTPFQPNSYDDFVKLTLKHSKTISWY